MNAVTRYTHPLHPFWHYLVTVDHWHTEPKGAQWNFSTAQAVQDFIERNFPGVTFRWDVRHAEDCAARLGRGECDCEIPTSFPDKRCSCPSVDAAECARMRGGGSILTHRGWECECPCHREFDEQEQLDIDRHEDARHDCFMEAALEPHDEPLG